MIEIRWEKSNERKYICFMTREIKTIRKFKNFKYLLVAQELSKNLKTELRLEISIIRVR